MCAQHREPLSQPAPPSGRPGRARRSWATRSQRCCSACRARAGSPPRSARPAACWCGARRLRRRRGRAAMHLAPSRWARSWGACESSWRRRGRAAARRQSSARAALKWGARHLSVRVTLRRMLAVPQRMGRARLALALGVPSRTCHLLVLPLLSLLPHTSAVSGHNLLSASQTVCLPSSTVLPLSAGATWVPSRQSACNKKRLANPAQAFARLACAAGPAHSQSVRAGRRASRAPSARWRCSCGAALIRRPEPGPRRRPRRRRRPTQMLGAPPATGRAVTATSRGLARRALASRAALRQRCIWHLRQRCPRRACGRTCCNPALIAPLKAWRQSNMRALAPCWSQ